MPIADPYRWLESADHPDTRAWVAAQNDLTERFLAGIPAERADPRSPVGTVGLPEVRRAVRAGRTVVPDAQHRTAGSAGPLRRPRSRRRGPRPARPEHHVRGRHRRRHRPLGQRGRVAAGLRHQRGRVGLEDLARARGGHRPRPGRLVEWSKFSGAAWRRDGSGFYYAAHGPSRSRPRARGRKPGSPDPLPSDRHAPRSTTSSSTPPRTSPTGCPSAAVSEDGRYLLISIQRGTNPETRIEVLDLDQPDRGYRTPGGGLRRQSGRGRQRRLDLLRARPTSTPTWAAWSPSTWTIPTGAGGRRSLPRATSTLIERLPLRRPAGLPLPARRPLGPAGARARRHPGAAISRWPGWSRWRQP